MPVTRERKDDLVEQLTQELSASQAVIITGYRTLKVADLQNVRNELRGMKAGYHIAKNTLLELALKNAGLPVPSNLLEGPTAVAFLHDDLSGPAKKLTAFFKEKELPIKGAIVGQTIYDARASKIWQNCRRAWNCMRRFWARCKDPPRIWSAS